MDLAGRPTSPLTDHPDLGGNGHSPPAAHAVALGAVQLEAEQHQQTMQRCIRNIDRLALLGPLLATVLLLPLALPGLPVREDWLAALIIVMMSAIGLLLHFNWTEFLELARYKYNILYPRLFSVAGQPNWVNYLEFTAPRSLRSWVPTFYFNLLAFGVLIAVWVHLLLVPATAARSAEAWGLCAVAAMGILATVRTSHIVILAARTLERDIKFALGRTWYPPIPFESPLCLVPSGDGVGFMVAAPIKVLVRRASHEPEAIEIERGFLTDLASVPQFLWPIFPPWERYGPAAVLHDYLYARPEAEWRREDADRVFRDVMRLLGVRTFERVSIYLAVRLFGGPARAAAARRVHPDGAMQARLLERFQRGERSAIVFVAGAGDHRERSREASGSIGPAGTPLPRSPSPREGPP